MTRIAGIIRKDWSADAAADLETMRARLRRQPSEPSDTWMEESLGVGVAWAGRPRCFADGMPIRDGAANTHLFFSGEILTDDDDHNAASNRAHRLMDLYERSGAAFLERLNGGFCGLLVDARSRHAVLFNDRYGSRRIYWHANAHGFYFATEAKALLAVDPRLRELGARALGELLSCGCVLQNRTLFTKISILPNAARWIFHPDGRCRRESYFSPQTWEAQPALSAAEYRDRLRETLRRVVSRHVRGDEEVGISLTGGIDSRLVLALAGCREGVSCYTFAGPCGESADVRLARRMAAACGLSHHTIRVDAEFLRRFPALAEEAVYLSDGAMDVSGAVELYVNQRAREIAPVRLTGNYGSEILRSHIAFQPRKLDPTLFEGELGPHLLTAEATYAAERRCSRRSFIAFKQVPWHHFARAAIERSQVTTRSPYLDNELVKLTYRAPEPTPAGAAFLLELAAEAEPALARIPTDRFVRAHPIPLLSPVGRAYQELAARAEYLYDYGMPQWLARLDKTLRLEWLFLGRHKFYHFRLWYRGALAEFVRAVLLDPRSLQRPYLNRRRLQEIVARHTRGEGNYTIELHKLMTLELLQRRLLEQG
jgi:asparagine synthase (glutamine-hydrolysing)